MNIKNPSLRLLIAALLVALTALVYLSATRQGVLSLFDETLLDISANDRNTTAAQTVTWFTNIGTTAFTAPIATVLVLWLSWKLQQWWPIAITIVAATCSVLTTTLVKEWLGRPRPEHVFAVAPFEYAPSFPSGHTLNAVVVFGIIAMLYASRRAYIAAGIYIVLMGASRIWLGHHWFSDVLAGWLLGIAWLLVLSVIFAKPLHTIRAARHAR
ncbi:phosphatase PAP2 family protein [Corynebacterium gerontici]|nr:phosphatase PAP2 family protein [Corynebacterium gerontici]